MRARVIISAVILGLAGLLAGAFALHLIHLPTFAEILAHEHRLADYRARYPLRLAAIYGTIVLVFAALPLPGAEALSIVGGALFGLVEGTLMIGLATSIGACGAFLVGRWWLGAFARRTLVGRLEWIATGLEREGAYYLFALRMIPAAPFFIVNLLMGATSLSLPAFFGITQLAVLPVVIVYVNAGRALGQIRSISGVVSPEVLASFAAVGLMPLASRHAVAAWRRWHGRGNGK